MVTPDHKFRARFDRATSSFVTHPLDGEPLPHGFHQLGIADLPGASVPLRDLIENAAIYLVRCECEDC